MWLVNFLINFDNITIICIDGVDPNHGLKALKYSMKHITFAKSIIISHIEPDNVPDNIVFEQIEPLTHDSYSPFVLSNLSSYVDTDYCLLINDDGFVINPELWDEKFLEYDYIGAPWKDYGQLNRVGNGGFSLRSKKLIDFCKHIVPLDGEHEDGAICLRHKHALEEHGCKFAPVDVAMKFSLESRIPECDFDLNNSFGFHGRGVPENTCDHDGFYHQFHDRLALLDTVE